MARFDGIVQGVVVQMRTDTGRPVRTGTRDTRSLVLETASGNST
jgi:hypothetical protein